MVHHTLLVVSGLISQRLKFFNGCKCLGLSNVAFGVYLTPGNVLLTFNVTSRWLGQSWSDTSLKYLWETECYSKDIACPRQLSQYWPVVTSKQQDCDFGQNCRESQQENQVEMCAFCVWYMHNSGSSHSPSQRSVKLKINNGLNFWTVM